ncbi:MAG: carbohydrate ABC transporter substrate-binding protein [Clostridia bacterium]|nr:carbohydrate ABC transporter substrate-binding protein [Clostridia bacterium]
MMNKKRILALLLVCLMILPCLAACNFGKTVTNDGGGQLTETDTIVPEDLKFTGETFTVLCREDNAWGRYLHEIAADEDATELVNEAVYKRNLKVEERFELEKLQAYAIPGQWAVNEDFINTFKNSILSASGSYDLIMSQQSYMEDISLIDLFYNFYDLPYVKDNLNAEYYYQDIIDEVTIDGKLLYMVGDYSLTYWEHLYVLFFNKTIAENHNIGDIYQLVRDGDWTYDRMAEMVKGTWTDLDGDSWPGSEDSYGYVTEIRNTTDALWDLFDIRVTSKDENGNVIIDADQGKMVQVLEKIIEFKQSDDTFFEDTDSSMTEDSIKCDKIFREGRALFYPAFLSRAQDFRGMETDFGIVPYPKWNKEQEKYYTRSQDAYSVAVVPIDAPNLEKTGAVFDLLSEISYDTVIPAYYDMALRDKYARDDESGEMLDIIREGFKFNFGVFYAPSLDRGLEFRVLITQDNSNYVSYYAVNQKGYERRLKKLMEAYAAYGEE